MENGLTFEKILSFNLQEGWMSQKLYQLLLYFYREFHRALKGQKVFPEASFHSLLSLIKEQHLTPFTFQPYHEKVRSPFDYYSFGNDLFRFLMDEKNSKIVGRIYIKGILSLLEKGENVIFFSNHQTEGDPQILSLLLDASYPGFAENIIFVAGERVTTDPLAIPFSMGRNLICIYSKRYIHHPPEKKIEKRQHNKKAMILMSRLLKEGGKCIYVAPSGGRDRRNSLGKVEVAPFDPKSIEMFYLMAKKSKTPTHFYPMSLFTYDLLPPPETIQAELGEIRSVKRGAAHLAVGSAIDMERFPGYDLEEKRLCRQARATYIWELVVSNYQSLVSL